MVKRIKNARDGLTVNDVVYAAFAGALRRHTELSATGRPPPLQRARCRALVPVAFPRAAGAPLTNSWAFVQARAHSADARAPRAHRR